VIFVCGETLSLESWIPITLVSAQRPKSDPPRGTSRMGTSFLRALSSTRANCHLPSARKYAVSREIERQQLRYRYRSASMQLHAPSCLQICIHDSSCPGAQVPLACRTRSLQSIPPIHGTDRSEHIVHRVSNPTSTHWNNPTMRGRKTRGRELRGSEP
jgi:hypothetical protein